MTTPHLAGHPAASQQAIVDAALLMLRQMGLSPGDLVTAPRDRPPVPTLPSIASAHSTWAEPPPSPIMFRSRRKARSAVGEACRTATAFTGYVAPSAVSFRRITAFSPEPAGSRQVRTSQATRLGRAATGAVTVWPPYTAPSR